MILLAAVSRAAGPLGLLVVLLLGLATVLLIRNMDKRVKNLPTEFPDPTVPAEPTAPVREPSPTPDPGTDGR